jgi:hypothetical protein
MVLDFRSFKNFGSLLMGPAVSLKINRNVPLKNEFL